MIVNGMNLEKEHRYYDEIDSAKAIYFIYDGG